MTKKIAINGFGRIGRLTLRQLIKRSDVEVVAINDLTDNSILAHLFEYDSTQGQFSGSVGYDDKNIIINGKKIPAFSNRNPEELPWGELEVDVVLECTGFFRKREQAQLHINAGAKRVLLSAPSSSDGVPTIVMGVNDSIIQDSDWLLSNASCTTNCLAPLVKVIDREWGIQHGFMSTIHAYTANQQIQDAPHKDLRRARAAAINMIPTSTGAAKALALVLPLMKGKISASSLRVPIPTGSLVELVCVLERDTTAAAVNAAFKAASQADLKGVLEYSEKPLVSTDIVSNTHSSIYDAPLTTVHNGMLKVTSWYDNEAGYSARLAEMAMIL